MPVAGPKHRPHVRDVAQRPQAFVGEAVVVALLLRLGQPDPPQGVARRPGRHLHTIVLVDDIAVGGAAALRDPGAGAGSHHRLHRGHQPAGGPVAGDAVVAVLVDVGLAIGDDDDLVGRKIVPEQRAQPLGAPLRDRLGLFAARAVDLPQQPLQVANQRLEAGAAASGPIEVVEIVVAQASSAPASPPRPHGRPPARPLVRP